MFLRPIHKKFLDVHDVFDGLKVYRTSEFNVFFTDGSRRSWRRVLGELEQGVPVSYKASPQVEVDWTDRAQALAYLRSFSRWGTYRSGTTVRHRVANLYMEEVVDGLIFHEGEWWVAGPSGTHDDWGRKVDYLDCLYDVELCRVPNNWWGNVKYAEEGHSIWVNVFFVERDHPSEWRDRRLSMIGI